MPEASATSIDIRYTANGQEVEALVPPNMLLIRHLRDQLGQLGTKIGRNSGHCGTSTVIVNS
jgi:aerobic-type carbon monoxide dehydrogenase small subunit (CoxS/CutS family)